MKTIPTKINKYNIYNEGNRLLGAGDELSLPEFEASAETISGAGILGEIDDPTMGYFGNQEMDVPFRILDQEAVDNQAAGAVQGHVWPGEYSLGHLRGPGR